MASPNCVRMASGSFVDNEAMKSFIIVAVKIDPCFGRAFIVMVQIDPYLGGAFLDCVCSHGGFHYYPCFGGASLDCVCSHAILAEHHFIVFAAMSGCWNANVVVNSDLGGVAWHHACNFAVFDAALSIPAGAYLSMAARHHICIHAVLCKPVRVRFSLLRLCLPIDYLAVETDQYLNLAMCFKMPKRNMKFAGNRIRMATWNACSHSIVVSMSEVNE
ncbi:hypothetical protein Tco_1479020, partial [Tanacetum coccineum]